MDRLNMEDISSNDHSTNWTNESHSNFLSLMEASFVKTMFKKSCKSSNDNDNYYGNCNDNSNNTKNNNRLNRYVPDIGESTLDLHSKKSLTPGAIRVLDAVTTQRQRLRSRPYKMARDQVVPQLEDRKIDEIR